MQQTKQLIDNDSVFIRIIYLQQVKDHSLISTDRILKRLQGQAEMFHKKTDFIA